MGNTLVLSREELLKENCHLLPNNELTLSCTVQINDEIIDEECKTVALGSSVDTDHETNSLTIALRNLLNKNEFTDILLKTKEKELPSHRTLLMARSSYFESIIKEVKDQDNTVVLDIETKVLEEIVSYIYTDRCIFHDVEFGIKLLTTAHQLGIPGLQAECVKYLTENMSGENVADIVIAADSNKEKELYVKCLEYICHELPSVTFFSSWKQKLSSSPKILEDIIQGMDDKILTCSAKQLP